MEQKPHNVTNSGPLNNLRVLDLGDLRTALGTRILADLGATVIKIEPREGDPTRNMPPFVRGRDGTRRSALYLSRNLNKQVVHLDLNTEAGREDLRCWIRGADVLFESFPPGYLDSIGLGHAHMRQLNSRMVICSVTDWGLTGPRAGQPGASLVALAASGALQVCGPAGLPPCNAPGPIAYDSSSIYGALGSLMALIGREHDGQGRAVEVSVQEATLAAMYPWSITGYSYAGDIPVRGGASLTVYPCIGGHIRMLFISDRHWEGLVEILGHPASLAGDEWNDRRFRWANIDVLRQLISELTRNRTMDDLLEGAHRKHIPSAALRKPEELLKDPNIVGRKFFRPVKIDGVQRDAPTLPLKLQSYPDPYPRVPSETETGPWPERDESAFAARTRASLTEGRPFEGMKVVSCCIGAVGPEMSRFLGDFGADVIKIESAQHPETMRLAATLPAPPEAPFSTGSGFNDANRGKRSVTINLKTDEGRKVLRDLVAKADILVENYRGDVARSWGIEFEDLRTWNPSIIYVSSQGFGRGGPAEEHSMMGPNLAPSIGLTYLWGHPEENPPAGFTLNYPDHLAGKIGLLALMSVLLRRLQTGDNAAEMIDLAQAEAGALLLGEHFLTIADGGTPARVGNSGRGFAAPHGVYPAKGTERWIAIAVETPAQWNALCNELNDARLTADARFATHDGRVQNEADLNQAIAAITAEYEPSELMDRLLKAGVPAATVMRADDHLEDPHLQARGAFVEIDHQIVGRRTHLRGDAMQIEGLSPLVTRPAPLMGEHTDEVCREWLSMDDAEIGRLRGMGILGA